MRPGLFLRRRNRDENQMSTAPGLWASAAYFSRIPLPASMRVTSADAGRAIAWFPALGLVIGLASGVCACAASLVLNTAVGAVTFVLCFQILVGATHLDGLADSVDGLAAIGSAKSGRDRDRALEIMRKPDIGAMGVVAIALVLAAQIVLLASGSTWCDVGLIGICGAVLARVTIQWATRPAIESARNDGFGHIFIGVTSTRSALVSSVLWVIVCAAMIGVAHRDWLMGLCCAGYLCLALMMAVLWMRRLVRIFGGMSGDLYGALIEVATTLAMAAAALGLAIR